MASCPDDLAHTRSRYVSPDRRHSFLFLRAVFVICVSRSHTYEVLISFS